MVDALIVDGQHSCLSFGHVDRCGNVGCVGDKSAMSKKERERERPNWLLNLGMRAGSGDQVQMGNGRPWAGFIFPALNGLDPMSATNVRQIRKPVIPVRYVHVAKTYVIRKCHRNYLQNKKAFDEGFTYARCTRAPLFQMLSLSFYLTRLCNLTRCERRPWAIFTSGK